MNFFLSLVSERGEAFFFGLATAPAHVEDKLNDAWLEFAVEKPCCEISEPVEEQKPADTLITSNSSDDEFQDAFLSLDEPDGTISKLKEPIKQAMDTLVKEWEKYAGGNDEKDSSPTCDHNIAAWHNVCRPYVYYVICIIFHRNNCGIYMIRNGIILILISFREERLRFWSDPDTELRLAKKTGVTVFRMGVDWTRIMPKEPVENLHDSVRSLTFFHLTGAINL